MGSRPGGGISESDFNHLLQTLSATAKGRSFLEDYRRRCLPRETMGLLDSLQRIETSIESAREQLRPAAIAAELRHIAMTLEIALDGAKADPEGNVNARRFALVQRARGELTALADSVFGERSGERDAARDQPAASPSELR